MATPQTNRNVRRTLASIIGVAAAATVLNVTPKFEGTIYHTYKDIGGVLTYCTGATENAIWGKTYTKAECADQLDSDLAYHAEGMMACTKGAILTAGQKAAFTDTTYNIGIANFCSSSMAREANRGNATASCNAIMQWDGINKWEKQPDGTMKKVHYVIKGIVNRRTEVRAICLKGL